MLIASCHCGLVRVEVESTPEYLNECHCSICRRYAVRWAYYQEDQVRIRCEPGATETYIWGDRMIAFHRCRACGCVTHWKDLDPNEKRMGINARLMEPADIAEVPVRQLGGSPS